MLPNMSGPRIPPPAARRRWNLHFVDTAPWLEESARVSDSFVASVTSVQTDADRARLGAFTARPFLIDEHGQLHSAVNRFFASARMRNRAASTNRRYARSLKTWINFLASRSEDWDQATEDSILTFMNWRLFDPANPKPVRGNSWSVDLAAIAVFYEWASRHISGPNLGFELAGASSGERGSSGQANPYSFRASSVRNADVKWLSPNAYRLWRNVGLLGLTSEGSERSRWRPRSQSRDSAFTDGLYSSGLRIGELSSLLLDELSPEAARLSGRRYATRTLPSAVTKSNRSRTYWMGVDALNAISIYVDTERADAARRAQHAGTYEQLPGASIIEESLPDKRELVITPLHGGEKRRLFLDNINPDARRLLFIRDGDHVAPAHVWLNEDGTPRSHRSWYAAFRRANKRVLKAGISNLACHPHMLRHSFALRWYAVARLSWERKWAWEDHQLTQDFRYQFGDSWSLVQTMLGHSNVSTTKNVYLEPFLSLNVNVLLEYGRSDLDPSTLWALLEHHPRVRTLSVDEKDVFP